MATIGKHTGNDMLFYTSTDGGTTYVAIGHSTDHTMSISTNTIDTNTKDTGGWMEKLASLKSATFSGEALHAFDATNGFDELLALQISGDLFKIKFATTETGDTMWECDVFIESLDLNAPQDEVVTYSYSLVSTGALTPGTVS